MNKVEKVLALFGAQPDDVKSAFIIDLFIIVEEAHKIANVKLDFTFSDLRKIKYDEVVKILLKSLDFFCHISNRTKTIKHLLEYSKAVLLPIAVGPGVVSYKLLILLIQGLQSYCIYTEKGRNYVGKIHKNEFDMFYKPRYDKGLLELNLELNKISKNEQQYGTRSRFGSRLGSNSDFQKQHLD